MDNVRILICDGDKSYVEALVRFLIGCSQTFYVTYDTDPETFDRTRGNFEVALMTEEYIRRLEKKDTGLLHIRHVIQLCGVMETGYRHYDSLYKFQPMSTFVDKLQQVCERQNPVPARYPVETCFHGIYSPMRHEMELPFSLVYSRFLAESGKTLFLDLEENSVLGELTGKASECSLLDVIYELKQQKEDFHVGGYTEQYQGFSYISPVTNPSDLVGILEEEWLALFSSIRRDGYANVVVLFGTLPQGFLNLVREIHVMYLLGKPGAYYQYGTMQFATSVKKMNPAISVQEVILPLSAQSLPEGNGMTEWVDGNLSVFVRSHFGGKRYAAAGG